jgi:hypothetical protein
MKKEIFTLKMMADTFKGTVLKINVMRDDLLA